MRNMRKLWILAILLPSMASAQVFSSVSMEKVRGSEAGDVRMAGISTDGKYALVTTMSNKGLTRVTLDDGEKVILSQEEGAGFQPVMSKDGRIVMCCSDTFDENHLRLTAVDVVDVSAGSSQRIISPTRNLGAFRLVDNEAEVEVDGRLKQRKVATRNGVERKRPTITCNGLKMQLTRNGQTVTLTPNGDDDDTNYIWASISPDGTHILYHVSTEGTYVCDLNGENVQYIAFDCYAPQWYDDNTIIGMKEKDDDLFITSSAVVAYTLDGARQQLTSDDDVLLYPFCSSEAKRIVCTRGNGEMVMLNVEK